MSEDFSEAGGFLDVAGFEAIYESFIDESFVKLSRVITLHMPPILTENIATQTGPASQQYNPFFGRSARPGPTRNTGAEVTYHDIQYHVHIKIGPFDGDDTKGIGRLEANEISATFVIEALTDIKRALSFSIEGRRYSIMTTRPIGFSTRKYVMCKLREINEKDTSTAINAG